MNQMITQQSPPAQKENKGKENTKKAPRGKESRAPKNQELTTEQITVMKDLRWLLSEGAVIAFGDGHIELATPRTPGNKQSSAQSSPKATRPAPDTPSGKEDIPKPKAVGSTDDAQDTLEDESAVENPDS